jgi:hypothetical protein
MSMELRARAAVASLTLDVLAFNPRQPRGPDGRWIKGGAGASPSTTTPSPPRAPRKQVPSKPAGRTGANSWLDAIRRGEPADDAKRQIGEMFEYTDPQTGYRSEVTQVDVHGSAERPSYFAVISIKDQTGLEVGRATRSIWPVRADPSKVSIHHGSFLLGKRAQGGGFSKRWLAQMDDRYREAGIDRITLFTDDVGGYAWAKAGFDFSDRDGPKHVATLVGRKLRSKEGQRNLPQRVITDGEELIRRAQSTDPEERPTPMEFAMLGWTPGAETWVGKESMLGSGWGGVKQL